MFGSMTPGVAATRQRQKEPSPRSATERPPRPVWLLTLYNAPKLVHLDPPMPLWIELSLQRELGFHFSRGCHTEHRF